MFQGPQRMAKVQLIHSAQPTRHRELIYMQELDSWRNIWLFQAGHLMEMYNLARNQIGRGENMTKGDFLKGLETDEELEREFILFFFLNTWWTNLQV